MEDNNLRLSEISFPEAEGYLRTHFKRYQEIRGVSLATNYENLRERLLGGPGMARNQMPVIEPDQIKDLVRDLKLSTDTILTALRTVMTEVPNAPLATESKTSADILFPTQEDVYLDKLVRGWNEYGFPGTEDKKILTLPLIVAQDGYLMDGHHRWASVFLINKSLQLATVSIPLDWTALVEFLKGYSEEIGNVAKESVSNMVERLRQARMKLQQGSL